MFVVLVVPVITVQEGFLPVRHAQWASINLLRVVEAATLVQLGNTRHLWPKQGAAHVHLDNINQSQLQLGACHVLVDNFKDLRAKLGATVAGQVRILAQGGSHAAAVQFVGLEHM